MYFCFFALSFSHKSLIILLKIELTREQMLPPSFHQNLRFVWHRAVYFRSSKGSISTCDSSLWSNGLLVGDTSLKNVWRNVLAYLALLFYFWQSWLKFSKNNNIYKEVCLALDLTSQMIECQTVYGIITWKDTKTKKVHTLRASIQLNGYLAQL